MRGDVKEVGGSSVMPEYFLLVRLLYAPDVVRGLARRRVVATHPRGAGTDVCHLIAVTVYSVQTHIAHRMTPHTGVNQLVKTSQAHCGIRGTSACVRRDPNRSDVLVASLEALEQVRTRSART